MGYFFFMNMLETNSGSRCKAQFASMIFMFALVFGSGANSQAQGDPGMLLIEAVQAGNAGKALELVSRGAPLEARDAENRTALLLATRANQVEIAAALIKVGADVNAKDSIHDTPFLYAGAEGRNDILKLILAAGKANLRDTNRYGGTALIPAAHHGHPETVRLLLETAIDVNHVNNLGWTALLEAVILGDGGPVYQEIVKLLLAGGADAKIADKDGVTPLAHAKSRGFTEMVLLIEQR
jgi:ankyrin repeat protein